jgi:hypothetical protein
MDKIAVEIPESFNKCPKPSLSGIHMIPDRGTTRNFDGQNTDSSVPEEIFGSEVPVALNVESVIDLTGEIEHLNERVMLHVRKKGGVTTLPHILLLSIRCLTCWRLRSDPSTIRV